MPPRVLPDFLSLPELEVSRVLRVNRTTQVYESSLAHRAHACPKCAQPTAITYDRRTVRLKDAPIRSIRVELRVKKRRLLCKPCDHVFTESISGVWPGRRTTQRFRAEVRWAAENFTDLKRVRRHFRVSNDFIYRALYEQLEKRARDRARAWPRVIGIDEHGFGRVKSLGGKALVTMFVDFNSRNLFELVQGRSGNELRAALEHIPGRENVQIVVMDMSDPYRKFVREFFPNARIVADKFHVLRLLSPALLRRRKEVPGDRRVHEMKRLMMRNFFELSFIDRARLDAWLKQFPELRELHDFKERLHQVFRIKGFDRATKAFERLLEQAGTSTLPEILRLRDTLQRWRDPILHYFKTGLTNARTEGMNNVAKVVKRRSYGFRSFKNYRLRVLAACSS
jgi:transposase